MQNRILYQVKKKEVNDKKRESHQSEKEKRKTRNEMKRGKT